jgi:hypothetical protein
VTFSYDSLLGYASECKPNRARTTSARGQVFSGQVAGANPVLCETRELYRCGSLKEILVGIRAGVDDFVAVKALHINRLQWNSIRMLQKVCYQSLQKHRIS